MNDRAQQPGRSVAPPPTIADAYADLLQYLSPEKRRGLISQLTVGFYDGWRPSRGEVADLVAVELGLLSWEEAAHRRRLRKAGQTPNCVAPHIAARAHSRVAV